jgi:hypothetical protein
MLQRSVARIRTNDSEFNIIHFVATELYSQRINTNLLASSPTCCGLT